MIRPKAIVAAALLALGLAAPARAQLILVKQSTGYTFTLPDLIAASDHVAGLTAQAGTVYLTRVTGSSGAVTKAASTNSISEVDSTNAPGQYTLTLTTAETGALGYIKGYYKSASSDPMSFTIKVVAYDPDSATNLGLTNLDATVSSRSTYAGGAVASVTGNVGGNVVGSVASVTGNVGGNVVGSVASVTTVSDKTGYSLANGQNFNNTGQTTKYAVTLAAADVTGNLPANATQFAGQAISAAAPVAVPSSISSYAGADTAGTTTLLARVPGVVQPQTGDAYARIGANGGGLTQVALASPPPTAGTIATAVRDVDNTSPAAGSLGAKVNSAASAGDPLSSAVPGSYASGTAGYLIGNRLDAAMSSRAAPAQILASPSNLLSTDSQGRVTTTSVAVRGTVVAGSSTTVIVVSGLPAGASYIGQRLYRVATGESKAIQSQSYGSPNYTFTLGSTPGTSGPLGSTPSAGETFVVLN